MHSHRQFRNTHTIQTIWENHQKAIFLAEMKTDLQKRFWHMALITHETKAIHSLFITCQSTTQLISQWWDFKSPAIIIFSSFLIFHHDRLKQFWFLSITHHAHTNPLIWMTCICTASYVTIFSKKWVMKLGFPTTINYHSYLMKMMGGNARGLILT